MNPETMRSSHGMRVRQNITIRAEEHTRSTAVLTGEQRAPVVRVPRAVRVRKNLDDRLAGVFRNLFKRTT